MPMENAELFVRVGIKPPKGVLLYGPPGTGKTLMARAVAAQTKATFLKLAASQLVQMYVGDGAKMVRDAFALARQKVIHIFSSLSIKLVSLSLWFTGAHHHLHR